MNITELPRIEPIEYGEPDTFPKGRVCAHCDTILSIYNEGPSCWLHKRFEREEEARAEEARERVLDALGERDRRILAMREIGYSFAEIAPEIGVSRARVQQIAKRVAAEVEMVA